MIYISHVAFGSIKAFHLVKQDADAPTSKGYCFVEYADPAATPVAVLGLNGMDLGGGKVLTARVAGERSGAVMPAPTAAAVAAAVVPAGAMHMQVSAHGVPPSGGTIVNGYDIEELVDAAMGLKPMPTAPLHMDQFGVPITRVNPTPVNPMMAVPVPPPQAPVMPPVPQLPPPVPQSAPGAVALPPGSSALDIANAALDAAFGMGNAAPPPPQQQQAVNPTRILVLFNMVTDEDLATDDEYQGLVDEVQGECAKYGKLLGMKIPRASSDTIDPTAIKKIFLEYATSQDAVNAERELAGRQFGPNVVRVRCYVLSRLLFECRLFCSLTNFVHFCDTLPLFRQATSPKMTTWKANSNESLRISCNWRFQRVGDAAMALTLRN